jgi:hypothetical protein
VNDRRAIVIDRETRDALAQTLAGMPVVRAFDAAKAPLEIWVCPVCSDTLLARGITEASCKGASHFNSHPERARIRHLAVPG